MAVTLTPSGSLNTTLDNYFISVLSNTSSVNLGAVSLKFNVPGGVIVKDVNAGISTGVSFLQKDKKLNVGFFTGSNWTVNNGTLILSITASGMATGSFTLDTDEDWYNEFASGSGDVFQNFDIRMPTLAANLTRVSDQLGVNSILSGINPTINAPSSSVFGFNNTTTGTASFAEGVGTLASGFAAHAAGVNTTASGYAAFSVGIETDADGVGSFAAGSGSNATGTASFAGGIRSLASGIASFAVGSSTTASGVASLTAGTSTRATAQGSVAFGSSTIAQGVNSFAVGQETTANTEASFAAGIGTFTEAIGQTTVGQWNAKLSDTKNAFLIGGGLNDSTRHNLFRAVGGKNSTNGDAERQIIIDVTSPTPELRSNSFFVVSGSSKFITGESETIELSGPTTITGTYPLSVVGGTLSVGGTTTLTGRLTANGAITTTSITASAVSASLVGTSNNVNLQLQTNNTTRVFISSSGNVGIGTTTPTERLHVDGNLLVTGRITAEEFHTEFVSASIIYQSGSTQFGNSSDDTHIFTGSLRVNGSITGSLFGTSSWAQNALTASFITPTGTNAFVQGGNSFGATALLGTNDNQNLQLETSGSVRMTINSSGNVGIGTTTPTAKLQTTGHIVGGLPDASAPVSATTLAGFTGLGSFNSSSLAENIDALYLRKGTTDGGSIGISFGAADGDLYFVGARIKHIRTGVNSNGHLVFETKNDSSNDTTVERMLITDEGNVGIGTDTPTSRLQVRGEGATSATTAFRVENSNQNASLVVRDDGNVGIGTTTPTERLHVDGNLLVTGRITAEEFHTEFVSASIIYQSGSTQFGNSSDDTHIFTGSLRVNGSITGSLFGTSSWAENAQTATLALTASSFSGQNFATFTQSVASTTWTFNHNLNFRTPVITVYDNSYQVVVPDSIQGTSDNQSVITFSTARAGYASATVGSVLPNNALSLMIAYSIVL